MGEDKLVPPKTSTNCWSPGTLSGVTMISIPVSGSASMEISGTIRKLPGKPDWKEGFAKKVLTPPPAPLWNPNNSGGIVGGFGVGFAMRAKFIPQPVWNLMLLFPLRNRLVPPTAVANGDVALAFGDTELMP